MKHLVWLLCLLVALAAYLSMPAQVGKAVGSAAQAARVQFALDEVSPTPTAHSFQLAPVATHPATTASPTSSPTPTATATSPPSPTATPTPSPSPTPIFSPTPEPDPYVLHGYTVQEGDTLEMIAERFNVAVADLLEINHLGSPDLIKIGQQLRLFAPQGMPQEPAIVLLPDSELVYSPAYRGFDTLAEAQRFGGYLTQHSEEVEGEILTGPQIVDRVAKRYSLGPRMLLTLLELQSGWVTQPEPVERIFPMGQRDGARTGLFKQLSWAADRLNENYYSTLQGHQPFVYFRDGTPLHLSSGLNPGSVAVENLLALVQTPQQWKWAVREGGFLALYRHLFGDPWARQITPLVPPDLTQPSLALPWAPNETWYYTGGPHGGWGEGSARAGLDFAPPTKNGCFPAPEWVLAVADGVIIRSENGEVVQDLDGDGFLGTGWTILYMHITAEERVPVGTWVRAGERIGHPSCEGGWSEATHLHIARRYNGQWMLADQPPEFVMEGWVPIAWTHSYEGELVRGNHRLQAISGRAGLRNAIGGQ
ncbi:MAG: LysM peptidoglycan-binding domain-containing protein [Chloroflexota bacterium]|nr:LysM peptidoglycan-binding domain-containing protein [Chloroflexota bacterium]